MTTNRTAADALREACAQIAHVADAPGAEAQRLLCAVLGFDRAHLLAHPEAVLTDDQAAAFAALVDRRATGEPLPYLLGRWPFYDRELVVTPDVLIPRPETELLLEAALDFTAARPPGRAIDIGTGSGALAVTLAALRPDWRVFAVDISPAALAVAQRSADLHGVRERVTLIAGDLLTPFAGAAVFDLVLANLPYIPSERLAELEVARREPRLALDGGADGLDLIGRLLGQMPSRLRPGGLALLEIDCTQGERAAALARERFPSAQIAVLPDLAGLDRVLRVALG